MICRSLREGGWRHERFEKGKKQEGPEDKWSGPRFPGVERVRRGRKSKLGREVVPGLEGLGCICQRISSGRK